MEVSIQQLGEKLQIDYATARGFIRVLELCGQAEECKKIRNNSGRGKSTVVYKILEKGVCIISNFQCTSKTEVLGQIIQLPSNNIEINETIESKPLSSNHLNDIFMKPNQKELEDLGGELI